MRGQKYCPPQNKGHLLNRSTGVGTVGKVVLLEIHGYYKYWV